MKIVFLGDSLTWGGYGGNFVAEIQQRLPDHEIINAGEGGNMAINLLRRLEDVLAQAPDGIFVMVGGNDAISNLFPETRSYYKQVQKIPEGRVTPEQFVQAYRDLLTQIQSNHTLAWVGLPPIEHSPALVEMLRQYNALARETAERLNIPVIDLLAALQPDTVPDSPPLTMKDILRIGERTRTGWSDYASDQAAGGFTFTFDGLHLTPDSARQVAEKIIQFLDLPA